MASTTVSKDPVLIAQGVGVIISADSNGSALKILTTTGPDKPLRADILANGTALAAGGSAGFGISSQQYIWGAVSTETFAPAILTVTVPDPGTLYIPPPAMGASRLVARNPKIFAHFSAQGGLWQEYNVTTAGTPAVTDGDLVGTWVDLIGGWDCKAAANDATRAVYHSGSSGSGVAGLPSVTFASNGPLVSAAGFWDALAATGFTIIALIKAAGTTSNYRIMVGSDNSNGPYFCMRPRVSSYNNLNAKIGANTVNAAIANANTGNQDDAALSGNTSAFENASCVYFTVAGGSNPAVAMGINGVEQGTGTGAGTVAGKLQLGNFTGGGGDFPCTCPIHEIAIYKGVLSAAEIQAETARLLSMGTVAPPLVVVDSNSFGLGYYAAGPVAHSLASLPGLIKGHLRSIASSSDVNTIQLSVSGQTTAQKVAASGPTLKLLGNWGSYRKIAHLLIEARNDMAQNNGNQTGEQAWANTVTMAQLAQSYGIRDVFIWTCPVSKDQTTYDAQFESRRQAYNALARANAARLGLTLVDICTLIPSLDLTASLADTTIFWTDGIHFMPATYCQIAYQLSKAVQAKWEAEKVALQAF